MTIAKLPVSAQTIGGYVNVSRQDADWTQPSIMDIIVEDLAGQYAIDTELEVCSELTTAAPAGPAIDATPTNDEIAAAFWTAAASIISATAGQAVDRDHGHRDQREADQDRDPPLRFALDLAKAEGEGMVQRFTQRMASREPAPQELEEELEGMKRLADTFDKLRDRTMAIVPESSVRANAPNDAWIAPLLELLRPEVPHDVEDHVRLPRGVIRCHVSVRADPHDR